MNLSRESLTWACETCDRRFYEWQHRGCPDCFQVGVRSSVRQFTQVEYARRRIRRALKRGQVAEAAAIADAVLDAIAISGCRP